MILGAVFVVGIGCGAKAPGLGQSRELGRNFRWAADDTARLLRTAYYFRLMGQPEVGLKELEQAHRLNPGSLQVTNTLAQFYDELGMGAQARQIYQEALALEPDNPVILNNLGFSYYLVGNGEEAERCFRAVLARHPQQQSARNNLGLLLCRQGRQEEARRLWQEAEGEAAADRLTQALAVLGMAAEPFHVQQSRARPEKGGGRPQPSSGRQPAVNPEAAAPPVRYSHAPTPAVGHRLGAEPDLGSPKPEVAAAKAATPPLRQQASGSTSQIPPASVAPERSAPEKTAPLRSEPAPRQAAPAGQPDSPKAVAAPASDKPETNRRPFLTARELVETNIAVLNGNGIPGLAHDTRSQLSREGFNVVAIGTFRDFGVDRTVIYCRPESKHLATVLGNKFFPRAEVKPEPGLAGKVDVKVVLGHDLHPQQHAGGPLTEENKSL